MLAWFLVAVLALSTWGVVALPRVAAAAVSDVQPRGAGVVTADALPTAQLNGVAWDQEIVAGTVFVGGSFSKARPAGAALGISESPRANLMAYTLSTGAMTSWNPGANAQIRTVTASPDGSRIYVGGDFTQVGGQARSRIAAFNASTGQLVSSFAPPVGYQVNDIVATDSTVYVAGSFATVGSQPRGNLAAFSASTGALLGWAPSVERQVLTIDISDDRQLIVIGGHFTSVNGSPARGLAKLDASTGALKPWPVPISDAGDKAAVNNLEIHGNVVSGTGFVYGPGGNQEGPWRLALDTGELIWVADCHGDSYDSVVTAAAVYVVGHAHYCGNVSMGFPQYSPWRYQHSMAWSPQATGTNIRDVFGKPSWDGRPSPSIISWLPAASIGSYTGQYQAGWTIESNGQYVVMGGEFPKVNNVPQQGLVRFATSSAAPKAQGPAFAGGSLVPILQPRAPGAVKVSWPSGYDRDDRDLTYRVVRTPGGTVFTLTSASTWWDTPGLSYVDTGLVAGSSYSYRVTATDSTGNVVSGATRSIVAPAVVPSNPYRDAVLQDGPAIYWALNEGSGTHGVADRAGGYHGSAGAQVAFGVPGPIAGDPAVNVNGTDSARIHAQAASHAPTQMSEEVWFRTTGTSGRLLGFGDLKTGDSGHRDRQIYLTNSGRVHFGVRATGTKVLSSPEPYNDNAWHHAVATLSGATARLYVDGTLVAERSDIVGPEEYVGYWRLGGDNQTGWPSPGNNNYSGDIDEMAIYGYALSAAQVKAHFTAAGTAPPAPTPGDTSAADAFERTVTSGFGSADVGGAWTPTGSSSPLSVGSGSGRITMTAPGSGPRVYLTEVSTADVDASVDFSLDKPPSGGDTYITLALRRIAGSEYRLKARLTPTSTMLFVTRSLSGSETILASQTLSGMEYRQGDLLRLRFQAVGTGSTALSAKMWRVGTTEPSGWQLSAIDSAAALQGSGGVGLAAYLGNTVTNAPVVARFDNLRAASVQK